MSSASWTSCGRSARGSKRRCATDDLAGRPPAGCRSASVELLGDTPFRLELAHSEVDLGAALRRRNARAEARVHLERGLDLAFRCGADALTARARAELAAAGARPRRLVLTGPDSLTGSERRVAELAASGHSNPEIARHLFVSRKTVETHLGRVYQKLGLSDRTLISAALSGDAAHDLSA